MEQMKAFGGGAPFRLRQVGEGLGRLIWRHCIEGQVEDAGVDLWKPEDGLVSTA
ncbi:hypothetical protein D3C87_1988690 [compost metagenome]